MTNYGLFINSKLYGGGPMEHINKLIADYMASDKGTGSARTDLAIINVKSDEYVAMGVSTLGNAVTVELEIPDSLRALVGYEPGREAYAKYVEPFWHPGDSPLILKFPKHIHHISSSFIDGFTLDAIHTIGYKEFKRSVTIGSDSGIIAQFWDRLY